MIVPGPTPITTERTPRQNYLGAVPTFWWIIQSLVPGLPPFLVFIHNISLVIPHFYFINSYNLFLDVAIEQGVVAGSIFIILYLGSVILVSRAIANDPPDELRLLRWLCLFALIVTMVHGFFYDYLYNGNGTGLFSTPLGMAMTGVVKPDGSAEQAFSQPKSHFHGIELDWPTFGWLRDIGAKSK